MEFSIATVAGQPVYVGLIITRGGLSAKPRTIPRSVIVRTGISGSGIFSSTAMMAASSRAFTAVAMESNLHPFERERDSLADADAHGRERQLAARALQFLGRGERKARAGHSERVAERDGAAVGVHAGIVVRDTELAEHGQALGGERLVKLDHVEIADPAADALHQLLACGSGPDAHDPRRNAGNGRAQNAGLRRKAVAFRGLFGCDDQSGCPVVHAGSVPGRHCAVRANDRTQLCKRLHARCAWVLVLVDEGRIALALRDLDR